MGGFVGGLGGGIDKVSIVRKLFEGSDSRIVDGVWDRNYLCVCVSISETFVNGGGLLSKNYKTPTFKFRFRPGTS